MRRTIALAALLTGCIQIGSNSDDAGAGSLDGTWAYSDTTSNCVYAVIFGGQSADAFEEDVLCAQGDGSIGMQRRTGTYSTTSDGKLTFELKRSTCPGDVAHSIKYDYAIDSDGLHLSTDVGLNTYLRSRGGVSGTITYGCYGADGFTPNELQDL